MSRQPREIDVRRQRNLTARETFRLCIRGVRHRMLRSLLTLSVVVLAVAFFMFLLSDSMFLRGVGRGVAAELEEGRLGGQTLTRLYVKPTMLVQTRRLSQAVRRGDAAALAEAAAVTHWDPSRVDALARLADDEKLYSDFFDEMPAGKRLALVGKRSGRDIFTHILAHREEFRETIAPMVDLRIPRKLAGLEAFLDAYPAYAEESAAFLRDWNAGVEAAAAVLARHKPEGTDEIAWIASENRAKLETWRDETEQLGFRLPEDDLATIREQFHWAAMRNDVLGRLNTVAVREAWTRAFRERKRTSADEKLLRLDDERAVGVLLGNAGENAKVGTSEVPSPKSDAPGFDAEDLAELTRRARVERRLISLEKALAGAQSASGGGFLGLSSRQLFLLCISFLVCMVGIANAMLMSITERFREIATMKCLGATDRYILLQFMMEAALQGLAGGLVGVVLGFAIAFLRDVGICGGYLFTYWPGVALLLSAAFSLVVGVLLAVLASVQPSWSASRMAPMEAMRIE